MATKNTNEAANQGSTPEKQAYPLELGNPRQERAPEATYGTEEATKEPAAASAPLRAPNAPTGLVGEDSRAVVEMIRGGIQMGVYQKHEGAAQAAADEIQKFPAIRLHPAVAQYKADAIAYLADVQARRSAFLATQADKPK